VTPITEATKKRQSNECENKEPAMSETNTRGLNVAEMNNLIATCRREAQRIRGAVADVNGAVESTWWKGDDADRFRDDWVYNHRRHVLSVASELETLAGQLGREVDNQIRTSSR
jgi:hypothetical protein